MSFKSVSCVILFPFASLTSTPENLSSTSSFKNPDAASEIRKVTFDVLFVSEVEANFSPPHPVSPIIEAVIRDSVVKFFIINPLIIFKLANI